ncbi:MFS transporter [Chryseolinea lacunae]|uniref:MFS transporter n=1 Tax=Chryseolinea lacunae TaxID=2801331 RepID=A0ABS1KUV2_9BACT|nr:MFS transporter [Chryseolinea lacunae]
MEKNNRRVINAWCSYDWANSVYNLTITTTLFPVYYSEVTRAAFGSEVVNFLGWPVKNTVLYSFAISFSFLIIVLLSPLLSGIADYSGRKKVFMQTFTYLGATACLGLFFFHGDNIVQGIGCSVLASVGYAGALVFYNSFLPEITTPDQVDRVSARGFSWGYMGSVVLLVVSLAMIMNYDTFGFDGKLTATRFSFLLVAIWWAGFAQFAFYFLKDRPTSHALNVQVITKGFHELRDVIAEIRSHRATARFLLAFFFYSMGVQTVILLAPLFGESIIGLPGEKLIITVLLLQVVAIAGSQLFAFVAARKGNKLALAIMLVIWMLICISAFYLTSELQFFVMAGFLGLVLGGTQAISRSTYSKLIPAEAKDTASYFSLYDVSEKLAIVLGTLSYGLIEQVTGSMRNSSLAMIVFFAMGLAALLTTALPRPEKK